MDKDFEDVFRAKLNMIISKNCELAINKSMDCNRLQEKLFEAYENHNFIEFCDVIIQMQIAAGITCYKLASKDIYELLEK